MLYDMLLHCVGSNKIVYISIFSTQNMFFCTCFLLELENNIQLTCLIIIYSYIYVKRIFLNIITQKFNYDKFIEINANNFAMHLLTIFLKKKSIKCKKSIIVV